METKDSISEEILGDFSPQWCQKLLNDASYEQSRPWTRGVGQSARDSHSSVMGKTLFTQQTLRAIRYLYKPARPNADSKDGDTAIEGNGCIGGELLALISLGDGMCSHPNTLHGGINTMLIDEYVQIRGIALSISLPCRLHASAEPAHSGSQTFPIETMPRKHVHREYANMFFLRLLGSAAIVLSERCLTLKR